MRGQPPQRFSPARPAIAEHLLTLPIYRSSTHSLCIEHFWEASLLLLQRTPDSGAIQLELRGQPSQSTPDSALRGQPSQCTSDSAHLLPPIELALEHPQRLVKARPLLRDIVDDVACSAGGSAAATAVPEMRTRAHSRTHSPLSSVRSSLFCSRPFPKLNTHNASTTCASRSG